jgi:SecD/SecF fusion protein
MLPTNRVEKDATNYAEQIAAQYEGSEDQLIRKREAEMAYLDSMSGEKIFSIPLLKDYTYSELKKAQLALGLDLKGGMSAVAQVDVKELIYALSAENKDENFNLALDNAEAAQANAQSNFVVLFGQEYAKLETDKSLAKIFLKNPALRDEINIETGDGEVLRLLRNKTTETVQNTFDRLRKRIDKLGVTQPNVTLDAARDLILVEMPGMDNQKRATEFITKGAKLEFWDTYEISDPGVLSALSEADRRLKEAAGQSTAATTIIDTFYQPVYDSISGEQIDSTLQTNERINPLGNEGPLFSMLRPNTGANMYRVVMGMADKKNKDKVMELLSGDNIKALFPSNSKFLWGASESSDPETGEALGEYELYLVKTLPGTKNASIEGDVINSAGQGPDPTTGQIQVTLGMKPEGAKKWADMTTRASQNGNRIVAIALDDEVVSAPRVNGPILGGNTSITGDFNTQEAIDLAQILEVGKLPANLDIIQSATVGPSLGQKNITSSMWSMIIGFGLVLLFMIFYYGGSGIISIIALFANMLFIFGALASFGTVLTLPGFAGIILTIGMAVDANVIIYERIREELRAGKSTIASITDGFKNSYSAIIDANVTTLLVAGVLAYFGIGPIKGFAVVLIIGVICSLFTAVLVTRLMMDWWTSKDRELTFWTGASKNAFANLSVDWLGKRKLAYVISGVILIAGIASMFTRGFDLGVDFKGGYSYTVQFAEDVEAEDIRNGLSANFGTSPVVKAVSASNTYQIVTDYLIDDKDKKAADTLVVAELYKGLASITGSSVSLENFLRSDSENATHIISSSKVGPTIADDIKTSSFYAGIFALILIFLYIFIRFNKWQYSLGAVAALLHDSLIVLSVFSLLWGIVPWTMEIDQAFIAAILTVIGYSINDTVVVFDRIREDMGIYTNKSKDEVINGAINSTFSRTIITSLTTLLMVAILFIFGGGSIKGFAFALLVGIIVGTYSSIFVATPIVRDLADDLKTSRGSDSKRNKKTFSRAASKS